MAIRPADHGIFASVGGGGPVAGYMSGRAGYGDYNRGSDKVAYASGTISQIANWITNGASYSGGYNGRSAMLGNGGVAGYFIGGYNNSYGPSNFGDRINWPADTATSLGQFIPHSSGSVSDNSMGDGYGFSDSGTAGYMAGGFGGSWPYGAFTHIFKFTYPSGSMSEMSSTLGTVKYGGCGLQNKGVAGYAYGGGVYGSGSTIDKVSFTSDSTSVLSSGTANHQAAGAASGASQEGVKGIVSNANTIDIVTYATDAVSSTGAYWTYSNYYSTGMLSFCEGQVNVWIVTDQNSNRQMAKKNLSTGVQTTDAGDIYLQRNQGGSCSNEGEGF